MITKPSCCYISRNVYKIRLIELRLWLVIFVGNIFCYILYRTVASCICGGLVCKIGRLLAKFFYSVILIHLLSFFTVSLLQLLLTFLIIPAVVWLKKISLWRKCVKEHAVCQLIA